MRVIGLMSGTSYDAIDAAAADLRLDGEQLVLTPLGLLSQPYPAELRRALAASLPPASTTFEQVCRLDTGIGQAFAGVARQAVEQLTGGYADLIVSHGQTVFHWVDGGAVHGTLQLGQPAWIAEATGVPVVSDLRTRDVAAGGQGAPLVSAFDVLWLRGRPGVPIALNLGGIANITVVAGEPLAFDTGPANALIDAVVAELTGGRLSFDADGVMAARGRVHEELFARLLAEPYYALPAPKSTGKELFNLAYLARMLEGLPEIPADDLVATVTALTARTVADAVRQYGGTEVIASGGGTRNPALLRMLAAELGPVPVRSTDELGVPSAAKEAYAFAVLGFLTVHGLSGTVPSCTGARHSSVLGSITPGLAGVPHVSPDVRPPASLLVNSAPH
ncbi:anhydro-N-acetylmuramic acid kinase [Kribbella sandramycini]|uniref:Anhydro-N-acetylmuramic acid kinase n=1 Tax=Kribbella sandramycini TaxID=60450 RepID=A0A7Y4KZK0_9ACTN|nr:anhydro-N-acetylmuramic acid kinase [Kribbella sandramycini]MBB6565290.1 anhydro-N-acetylmuramic acid kinase [Kribbella sandramycini]NOL41559.1 anhydro-N-acetylmuramic acid kinase [Kribbella sandramycini]